MFARFTRAPHPPPALVNRVLQRFTRENRAMSDDTTTADTDVEFASVEWRGKIFTFPADVDDWPVDAVEAFENGKAMAAVHLLLGEKQWAQAKRLGGRVRDVSELFELLAKAAGFGDSGE